MFKTKMYVIRPQRYEAVQVLKDNIHRLCKEIHGRVVYESDSVVYLEFGSQRAFIGDWLARYDNENSVWGVIKQREFHENYAQAPHTTQLDVANAVNDIYNPPMSYVEVSKTLDD